MVRMARLVVPGYSHHVTQGGNRRQKAFFCADDYAMDGVVIYGRSVSIRLSWMSHIL
jgi:REP element-mobilizing transposase RayT